MRDRSFIVLRERAQRAGAPRWRGTEFLVVLEGRSAELRASDLVRTAYLGM